MIQARQIMRMVETQEFRRLSERILANGRLEHPRMRQFLTQPSLAATIALGLALQRLCELTYAPSSEGDKLAGMLLNAQRADGTFAPQTETGPAQALAVAAIAVRGLLAYADQHRQLRLPLDPKVERAIQRGLRAVGRCLPIHHSHAQDGYSAIAWTILLWQLGDRPEFLAMIDAAGMLDSIDDPASENVPDQRQYTRALAA